MTKTLNKGQQVSWNSHCGKAHGKVVKTLTSPTRIKSHKVAAWPDNPEVIVEKREGKRAAHAPSALTPAHD